MFIELACHKYFIEFQSSRNSFVPVSILIHDKFTRAAITNYGNETLVIYSFRKNSFGLKNECLYVSNVTIATDTM